jgi:hypothetical protein
LISPITLLDVYNALKNIKRPESCDEDFNGILEEFSEEPIAETIEKIESLLRG